MRLPTSTLGGGTLAASSSASELPRGLGLRRRGVVSTFCVGVVTRGGAPSRNSGRERRERLGPDEQLGGREQLLGEVPVAALELLPGLVELVGGLAQDLRLLAGGAELGGLLAVVGLAAAGAAGAAGAAPGFDRLHRSGRARQGRGERRSTDRRVRSSSPS